MKQLRWYIVFPIPFTRWRLEFGLVRSWTQAELEAFQAELRGQVRRQ